MSIVQSGFDLGGTYNGTPAPVMQTLASNYVDFTTGANQGWAQQYLPELIEAEAEVFGNRTLSGFLSQVGAEEGCASDYVVWSEQGRLHLKYSGALKGNQADASADYSAANSIVDGLGTNALRVGDTVLVSSAAKNVTIAAYVASTFNDQDANNVGGAITLIAGEVALIPFGSDSSIKAALGWADGAGDNDPIVITVYGSEYKKGVTGRTDSVEPSFLSRKNKMMILKDLYEVSGSDASQIGWVEVSGENGQTGYMWYLKAEGETRSRFADYTEMAMIETVDATNTTLTGGDIQGSEGYFAALDNRGIIASGLDAADDAATALTEFDNILKEFDKQGAIEEYMMFVNRDVALTIDDMLAGVNHYGATGTSFGVFNNSEDMALNLGFSGFRRGSYDFYKTDWKYLNDQTARGAFSGDTNNVRGTFVPAGVSTVYDQSLGRNLKRPFLHVRFRASQTENRKMKTWITGSVGAATSDLDAMQVNFLSERCLIVQGANNFVLLKG